MGIIMIHLYVTIYDWYYLFIIILKIKLTIDNLYIIDTYISVLFDLGAYFYIKY